MFVYGCNLALSFVFTNNNDEYLLKKFFFVVFCLLYTWFSGKHKTGYCPKVVRDRSDVVGLELYVGDSLKNVGDSLENVGDSLKNVGVFWKTLGDFFWTWEIFSHKWESPKNRPQRNGFAKPLARVTRARITGIFIFSLSQPSHNRWFWAKNRPKMYLKRKWGT